MKDGDLAAAVAEQAGRLLLDMRAAGTVDGEAIDTAGRRVAGRFLRDALRRARPDNALLSAQDTPRIPSGDGVRCWMIDPLVRADDYAEGGDSWSVSIGLSVDRSAAAGAVTMPARGIMVRSGQALVGSRTDKPLRLAVGAAMMPGFGRQLASALGAEIVDADDGGIAVCCGDADAFVDPAPNAEWSLCGIVAAARDSGLHASCLSGARIVLGGSGMAVPGLILCRKDLGPAVIRAAAALDCGARACVA